MSTPKTFAPFFLLSLSLHLLLLIAWPKPPKLDVPTPNIPVSLIPAQPAPLPQERRVLTSPTERAMIRKPAPRRVAKQTPLPQKRSIVPSVKEQKKETIEAKKTEPVRELRRAELTERPLPSLKELLPPATWSTEGKATSDAKGPIHLDTREPLYLPYFETIKRAIERVWEYPETALQSGLEGRLILEFTVLDNGALVGPRLVRSSGFLQLDEEAMRAVRAASPFRPIPTSIGRDRIDIVASFEYYDNRLRYNFNR
jgi:protein TonB